MDRPYKYELGKQWWTVYYGKVLLTTAHCYYNMSGGNSVAYTIKLQDGKFVEIDETDLSVGAEDLNELQKTIYKLEAKGFRTIAKRAELMQATNEAYEELRAKDNKTPNNSKFVGCPYCWGSGVRESYTGLLPDDDWQKACYQCGGTGKLDKEAFWKETNEAYEKLYNGKLPEVKMDRPMTFYGDDDPETICTECFGLGRVSDTWIVNGQLKCNSLDWEPLTRICPRCHGTGVEPIEPAATEGNITNGKPPTQDRMDDLVEQVKAVLQQTDIDWESCMHPCVSCDLDETCSMCEISCGRLIDLQRALRAYLGEERP